MQNGKSAILKKCTKVLLPLMITFLTVGCSSKDSSFIISREDGTYILAEDLNGDGIFDSFDSNGDGKTDISYGSSDSNIDTEVRQIADFEVSSINGKTYNNEYFSNNRLTVIVIWGYWCPDCMFELYGLSNYEIENGNKVNYLSTLPSDVGVFGLTIGTNSVNSDNAERFETVIREYSDIYGIEFDNVLASDNTSKLSDSIRQYKTDNRDYSSTVPAVAIVDAQGNIREVIYEGSAKQIVTEIDKYLHD